MILSRKRHKLLKLLSIHRNNVELGKAKQNALGVSFEIIFKELNCNEDKLQIITSELYTSDEIGYHNAHNINGLFATDKGLSAFSNRKYIKIYWDNFFNTAKNIVQVFIPVFSLIIAYVALTTKSDNLQKQYEKELQEVKFLLLKQQEHTKLLEDRIEKIQVNPEKNPNEKKIYF